MASRDGELSTLVCGQEKEEPIAIWQDKHVAVFAKGPGWLVSISRKIEQNKALLRLLQGRNSHNARDLVRSGRPEHFAHFVIMKFKEDAEYELADDVNHEFGIAHRLDVDTSGALMLGKTLEGFSHLRNAFNKHEILKEYICLVHGPIRSTTQEIELPIFWDEAANVSSISQKGLWAKSIFTVMGRYRLKGGKKIFTLCRVVIITGRTHQIRVHMSAIGHPLVSDGKYNTKQVRTDKMWCPRLFLHAWRLGFADLSATQQEVTAPLSKDLKRALRQLEEVQLDFGSKENPSLRVANKAATQRQNDRNTSVTPVYQWPPPATVRAGSADDLLGANSSNDVTVVSSAPVPDMQVGQGTIEAPGNSWNHISKEGSSIALVASTSPTIEAPWMVDSREHEKACAVLIEMGFRRTDIMHALRVNHGDIVEAMDMLASTDTSAPELADALRIDAKKQKSETYARSIDESDSIIKGTLISNQNSADGEDEGDIAKALEISKQEVEANKARDEQDIAKALELSQQEEEQTQKERALYEQNLTAALTASLEERSTAGEDDRQLQEALEVSQHHADERQRQKNMEDAEFERACRESMHNYQLFHMAGDEQVQDALRRSLQDLGTSSSSYAIGGDASDEVDAQLRKAVQNCYCADMGTCDDEDEIVVFRKPLLAPDLPEHEHDKSRGSTSDVASAASKGEGHPALILADTKQSTIQNEPAAAEEHSATQLLQPPVTRVGRWAKRSSTTAPLPSAPAAPSQLAAVSPADVNAPTDCCKFKDWATQRMSELGVSVAREALWCALNEIEYDQLGDMEVVKMWLGLRPEEELPHAVMTFAVEFRQRKCHELYSG